MRRSNLFRRLAPWRIAGFAVAATAYVAFAIVVVVVVVGGRGGQFPVASAFVPTAVTSTTTTTAMAMRSLLLPSSSYRLIARCESRLAGAGVVRPAVPVTTTVMMAAKRMRTGGAFLPCAVRTKIALRSSSPDGSGEEPPHSSSSPDAAAADADAAAAADAAAVAPATFREAEVLGLRYMQEGRYDRALNAFTKGMKLPGSRSDIVRTKMLSGPSPVGGATGGTEGKLVMTLDEFELQAAHYNIACAHAKLGNVEEAIANLKMSFDSGFDNYATVRADPDLSAVHGTEEFNNLMDTYDAKRRKKKAGGGGFPNPFSFLG